MSIVGRMSVLMRLTERTPKIAISVQRTAMVYGRRRARRTIHMGPPFYAGLPRSRIRNVLQCARARGALRGGGAQRRDRHAGAGHAAAQDAAQRLRSAAHRSALLRGDRRHRARPPLLPPLPATGVGPPAGPAARARGPASPPLSLQRAEHHLLADPRPRG